MNELKLYEMIRQTANAEVEIIREITEGLTNTHKYKVKIKDRFWMVKISEGTPMRLEWYKTLLNLRCTTLVVPEMYQLFNDNKLCLISPWIDGESLESILKTATNLEIADYGNQATKLLISLHSARIFYSDYIEHLQDRVESVCKAVRELNLTFPGHEECCKYVETTISNYSANDICLVHRDVRPENFIVKEGELFLIDFDNGSIGEPESDFVYLTTMGQKEHLEFSKNVICNYLEMTDNAEFWSKNLFYSALQVMEYAVWKWLTKGKQVYFQADNLITQYEQFNSTKPQWWNDV